MRNACGALPVRASRQTRRYKGKLCRHTNTSAGLVAIFLKNCRQCPTSPLGIVPSVAGAWTVSSAAVRELFLRAPVFMPLITAVPEVPPADEIRPAVDAKPLASAGPVIRRSRACRRTTHRSIPKIVLSWPGAQLLQINPQEATNLK